VGAKEGKKKKSKAQQRLKQKTEGENVKLEDGTGACAQRGPERSLETPVEKNKSDKGHGE